jgi:hypothetical protein
MLSALTTVSSEVDANFNFNRALANTNFADTPTMISSSLTPGTLVNLAFTLDLENSVTAPAFGAGGVEIGCAAATAGLLARVADDQQTIGFLSASNTQNSGVCGVGGINNTVGVFQAAIGDEVNVYVNMEAFAWGRLGANDTASDTLNLRRSARPFFVHHAKR